MPWLFIVGAAGCPVDKFEGNINTEGAAPALELALLPETEPQEQE